MILQCKEAKKEPTGQRGKQAMVDIKVCYPLQENPAFLLVHYSGSIFNDHTSN